MEIRSCDKEISLMSRSCQVGASHLSLVVLELLINGRVRDQVVILLKGRRCSFVLSHWHRRSRFAENSLKGFL